MPEASPSVLSGLISCVDSLTGEPTSFESITGKFTIGFCDFYYHVRIDVHGKPIGVDLKVSNNGNQERHFDTEDANELATKLIADSRAYIELICREATELLSSGVWNIQDLIDSWCGIRTDPAGICRHVEGIVSSPLDAFGRICRRNRERWFGEG